jgi:signal transduction histidine kinase
MRHDRMPMGRWPGARMDQAQFSVAMEPSTSRQRRLALGVLAVLLVAAGVVAPFSGRPLAQLDAFAPTTGSIIFINDLVTSVFLFSLVSIRPSLAVLALASGYLFSAFMAVLHSLTFPGAFAPTDFGANPQSEAWLYAFWHIGFPLALFAYAWLKNVDRPKGVPRISSRAAIGWTVALTFALVFALCSSTAAEILPALLIANQITPLAKYLLVLILAITLLALGSLWYRGRTVLDQWLVITACAQLTELVLIVLLPSDIHFSLGFYAGRACSVFTSTVVLVMLLTETTRLYGRLVTSNLALHRERNNKLMNLEAMAASISHEVKQPLAAIATDGYAAKRFLRHAPPNLEEVLSALDRMVVASHRAAEVFDNLRALFGSVHPPGAPVDVNEIVLSALSDLRGELVGHGVTARTALAAELPRIMGHRGQLQEVILNLARNGIEAMAAMKGGDRVLQIKTEHNGGDAITVAVEDTGPGIEAKKLESIFDAFFTTRPQGMGLGLAICRMIIDRHGGQLNASSDGKRGALFQFVLPIQSTAHSSAGAP